MKWQIAFIPSGSFELCMKSSIDSIYGITYSSISFASSSHLLLFLILISRRGCATHHLSTPLSVVECLVFNDPSILARGYGNLSVPSRNEEKSETSTAWNRKCGFGTFWHSFMGVKSILAHAYLATDVLAQRRVVKPQHCLT